MNKSRKTFIGKVMSSKMAGVVVVVVERLSMHPKYKKSIKQSKKYHVANTVGAKLSDRVEFRETRPLSRTIRWQTIRLLGKPEEKNEKNEQRKRKVGEEIKKGRKI